MYRNSKIHSINLSVKYALNPILYGWKSENGTNWEPKLGEKRLVENYCFFCIFKEPRHSMEKCSIMPAEV